MGYESRVSAWGWHSGSQEYIWQRKHSIGCYLGHSSPERKILEIKEHMQSYPVRKALGFSSWGRSTTRLANDSENGRSLLLLNLIHFFLSNFVSF